MGNEEIIISEGATDDVSEERQFTATKGAQSTSSLQLDASKDLIRMINRKSKTKPKRKENLVCLMQQKVQNVLHRNNV